MLVSHFILHNRFLHKAFIRQHKVLFFVFVEKITGFGHSSGRIEQVMYHYTPSFLTCSVPDLCTANATCHRHHAGMPPHSVHKTGCRSEVEVRAFKKQLACVNGFLSALSCAERRHLKLRCDKTVPRSRCVLVPPHSILVAQTSQ